MPISDEVIELAPVKKTKKTFIIMLVAIGVLLALAGTFLVLYLIKPSVTEQSTIVRGVTMSSTELFTTVTDGKEAKYASIGNEYTVYANITVEKGASPNIQWEWPRDAINLIESTEGEGAYFKFKPREGFGGQEVTIKARSQSNVNKSDSVTFFIINQGAEDLKINEYGYTGNIIKIDDEKPGALSWRLPYYTNAGSNNANNKTYRVGFTQYGKFDPTTGEYNKITSVGEGAEATDYVEVKAYKTGTKEESDVIAIGTKRNSSFDFRVLKAGSADIVIEANSNNDSEIISKKIEITVETNANLNFADTVYFFNKPIVDGNFIKSVISDRNNTQIDTDKLGAALKKDSSLQMSSTNANGAELVLPYNYSGTYDDIFKHILINPITIQYNKQANEGAGAFREGWYKNISVSSSNSRVLGVKSDSSSGAVKLETVGLSGSSSSADKCNITIADKTAGSIGAGVTIPVRVVAQNEFATMTVSIGETKYEENDGVVTVQTAPTASFNITLVYTLVAPNFEKPETIAENLYFNNAFELNNYKFDKETSSYILDNGNKKVKVKFKNKTTELAFGKQHSLDSCTVAKLPGGNSRTTRYTATVEFTVSLENVSDGEKPSLKFTKTGIDGSFDKTWDKEITFNVTAVADSAVLAENNEGLQYITKHGTENENAGNYILGSDKKSAAVYVQNAASGTQLEISTKEGVKPLLKVNAAAYDVVLDCTLTPGANVFEKKSDGSLGFAGYANPPVGTSAKILVNVFNVAGTKIEELTLNVYVIDAIEGFSAIDSAEVLYSKDTSMAFNVSTLKVNLNDFGKVTRKFNIAPSAYSYATGTVPLIDIYYGGEKTESNKLYRTAGDKAGQYRFKYTKDDPVDLYIYDANRHVVYPATDLYSYSYFNEYKIDFGSVYIEFLLDDRDEYVGKHYGESFKNTATMFASFTRKADDVALFTSSDYSDASKIARESNESDALYGKLRLRINQGKGGDVYVSSVVELSNGTKITALAGGSDVAPVERSYIRVPENFEVNNAGEAISGKKNCYYHISFTAPLIDSDSGEEFKNIAGFSVCYSDNREEAFVLTVENAARPVKSIGIYSDEECKNLLERSPGLLFGFFANGNERFMQTVYVKIEYDAYMDRHTMFESAVFVMPSYLQLTVRGEGSQFEGELPEEDEGTLAANGRYRVYDLCPSADKIKDKTFGIFKCELFIRDNAGATAGENDYIFVERTLGGDEKLHQLVDVGVDCGLDSITVKDANSDNLTIADKEHVGEISHEFFLSGNDDKQTLTLNLTYKGLADDKYAIDYDYTDAANFIVEYPENQAGLIIGRSVKGDVSQITIGIGDAKITNGYVTLTFKFTDKFNGVNEVFTLNVKIKVEIDVFGISFGEDQENVKAVYNVVTQKANAESTAPVTVLFNNNDSTLAPKDTSKVKVYIATKNSDGSFTEFKDDTKLGLRTSADGYTLFVKNSIKNSSDYYVVAEYNENGKNIVESRQIVITTSDYTLSFADGNTVTPVGGKAEVYIDKTHNSFKLAAVLSNDGGASASKTVTYWLYTDATCRVPAGDIASITTDGSFIIEKPVAAVGKLYYKASYVGTDITGVEPLVVEITYTVKATGVELNAMPGLLNGDTITLYYIDGDNYVYADLTGFIKPISDFGVAIDPDDANYSLVSSDPSLLSVNSGTLEIVPNGPTDTKVITLTVKAGYGNGEATAVYKVVVKPFGGVTLNLDKDKIDIIKKDTLTVGYTVTDVDGFTSSYSLTASNGLKITDNSKVSLDGANTVGDYALTAKVVYTAVSGTTTALKTKGKLERTAEYTLPVDCEYVLDFELKHNNVLVPSGQHALGSDLTGYTVSVKNTSHGDANASYLFEVNKDIISIVSPTGSSSNITVNKDKSGEFTIKLTATVYGKEFEKSYTYTFMYGLDPVAELTYAVGNGSFAVVPSGGLEIDYLSESDKKTVKYTVSNVDMDAEVKLTVSGGTASAVQKDETNKCFYITVDAIEDVTLYFGGTVKVGTHTVYLDQKSVTLTSVKPDFDFASTVSGMLDPLGFTTLDVSNKASGFKGNVTSVFSVLVGGEYVTLGGANNNVLTANSSVTNNQTVRVKAEITVNSGVYAGKTYEIFKDIQINGVPLPILEWKFDGPVTVTAGGTLDITGKYGLTSGFDAFTGKIDYSISAAGSGTLSGNTLSVENTATAKAGGKIKLTLGGKVKENSGANQGEPLEPVELEVVILPVMNVKNFSVPNAKGSVDLNAANLLGNFAPHTGTLDGQITSSDTYKVVSLAFVGNVDASKFAVDGGKLVLLDNIIASTEVKMTVSIMMTSGAYKGYVIDGEVTVTVAVPATGMPTAPAEFDNTKKAYKEISVPETLSNVASIDVIGVNGITVTGNGTASPKIVVDKNYNLYISESTPSGNKEIAVPYYVTLKDGATHYRTLTITVPPQAVTLNVTSGGETLYNGSSTISKEVGEQFIVKVDAGAFDVAIQNKNSIISGTTAVSYDASDNSVVFRADSTTESSVQATLSLNVDGIASPVEFTFNIAVVQPQTGDVYTIDNTELNYKYGESAPITSTWTHNGSSAYKYGYTLTVSVGSGKLSDYFNSIVIDGETLSLNNKSGTHTFDRDHYYQTTGFTLSFTAKTDTVRDFTFTVSFVVYNSSNRWGSSSQTITQTYRVNVIDTVAVTLDANTTDTVGGITSTTLRIPFKGTYTGLPTPTRTGYNFNGWFTERTGGSNVSEGTAMTAHESHTLYAQWELAEYQVGYEWGYTPAPGGDLGTKNVQFGSTFGELATVTRTGYTFTGWYYGDKLVTKDTKVFEPTDKHNITLVADWTANVYTVSFSGSNMTSISNTKAVFGENLVLPTPRCNDGYEFKGWYLENGFTNGVPGTLNETVAGKANSSNVITLYAKVEKITYDITFEPNGGAWVGTAPTVTAKIGEKYSSVPADGDVVRNGYRFDGWYTRSIGGTRIDGNTTYSVELGTVVYAHWTQEDTYTVTFVLDGGKIGDKTSYSVSGIAGGNSFDLHTLLVPTRDGYRFDGWFTNVGGSETNVTASAITVNGNVTITAKWTQVYTVTFVEEGKDDVVISIASGSALGSNLPTIATKPGFTAGWYNGDTQVTADTQVTGAMTLTAKWAAAVMFVEEGKENVTVTYFYGDTYGDKMPSIAVKDGFTSGWYNESDTEITSDMSVTGNITLTANWTADDTAEPGVE